MSSSAAITVLTRGSLDIENYCTVGLFFEQAIAGVGVHCVPMREKRPLTRKQLLAGKRLSVTESEPQRSPHDSEVANSGPEINRKNRCTSVIHALKRF